MKKSILKSAAMLAAISLSFLTFSCDKPLSSSFFDQKTVETSRSNAQVTVIFHAGTIDGLGTEKQPKWTGGPDRKETGVIGTPCVFDNPSVYGYTIAGWKPTKPSEMPEFNGTFPEVDAEYTAQWTETPQRVIISKKRIGLYSGKSSDLSARCLPKTGGTPPTIIWTSSNPAKVSVNQNGKVIATENAKKGDIVTITASTTNGLSEQCQVLIGESLETLGELKNLGTNSVSFGTFPQTIKADKDASGKDIFIFGDDVAEDDPMYGVYAEMEITEDKDMVYFLGTDFCWYTSVNAMPHVSQKYSNGKSIENDKEDYFKVEALKWRVMPENNNWLVSEYVLTCFIKFYASTKTERTLGSTKIYPNNWKYSNLRAYLNGTDNQFVKDGGTRDSSADINWTGNGFIDIAFTENQRKKLKTVTVPNDISTTMSKKKIVSSGNWPQQEDLPEYYWCGDTQDKVFMLSSKEAFSHKDSYGSVYCVPFPASDYAKANNCYSAPGNDYTSTRYYLRTPAYGNENCKKDDNDFGVQWVESGRKLQDPGVATNCTNTGILPVISVL